MSKNKKSNDKRKNLCDNEKAMQALKFMVKCNLSNKEISDELHKTYKYPWAPCTIGRNREGAEAAREKRATASSKDVHCFEVPFTNIKIDDFSKECFPGVDPATLSFGDFCSYTASFFDCLATRPRGEGKAPKHWWQEQTIRIMNWNRVRERTVIKYAELTKTQLYALDHCVYMYSQELAKEKHYIGVYPLYRKWKENFILENVFAPTYS
jgi:hypothetical protein